jgi:hypothetical protein
MNNVRMSLAGSLNAALNKDFVASPPRTSSPESELLNHQNQGWGAEEQDSFATKAYNTPLRKWNGVHR